MEYVQSFSKRNLPCKAHIVRLQSDRLRIMVENKNGFTDWPILVDDKMLWNYPERFPEYAKDLAYNAFQKMRELQS